MLDQKRWADLFSAVGIGFLVITLYLTGVVFLGRLGLVSVIVVLLLGAVAFYLIQEEE